MRKRSIIIILILLLTSLLIWGQTKWGLAEERYYSYKILQKLDEILKNQKIILKELKELKKSR